MSEENPPKKPLIGKKTMAVGIGSAALAAALLYASKRKAKPKPGKTED